MTTARPPDFEPLAGADPVPADTDETVALGKRYTDTAAEIESQASNLRRLTANTTGGWVGKAGDAFQSHAAPGPPGSARPKNGTPWLGRR